MARTTVERPGSAIDNFNVELVIRIKLVRYASAYAKYFEHARCSSTEDDDGKNYDYQNSGAEKGAIRTAQSSSERYTDCTTQTGPEKHCLVRVGQLIYCLSALSFCSVANDPIDGAGKGKDDTPSGHANANDGDKDEQWLVLEVSLSQERQTKVDEDEILGKLSKDLEDVFGAELRPSGHVVMCVVFEADSAE